MKKAYRKFSDYLGSPLTEWTVNYRVHATRRMFKRKIGNQDVNLLLNSGQVIEEYREDFPLPSILVNGLSTDESPLHAVIGIEHDMMQLHVITVYRPDHKKWSKDYARRIMP
jgi:hypothetical protein